MLNRVLNRNDFTKNVVTLITGTTIAQAIPIVITPILTRMYTPEDFGVLALFVAIVTIIGSVANGRYELAIMLPLDDDEAINIAALALLISTVLSFLLFIPSFLLNDYLATILNNQSIGFWLYFVPLVVWFLGLYNVLSYLNNRMKSYKSIAASVVYRSVVQASVQIGIGSVKATAGGLISGQIMANVVANARLIYDTKRYYRLSAINRNSMRELAKRYISFPKYSMWAILANTLSYQFLNVIISLFYSVSTLGFYSLAQRILGLPTSLIGDSIGRVYFQQATIEKRETGKANNVFRSTTRRLLLMSCIFFLPLYFILPFVFSVAFGQEWRIAGEYAQLLLPVFMFRFVSAALSTTNSVFEKQGLSLLWQVGLLILSIGSLVISSYYDIEFEGFLRIYSLLISLHYIILYFILKYVAEAKI